MAENSLAALTVNLDTKEDRELDIVGRGVASGTTETCSRCGRTVYLKHDRLYEGLCEDCATTCPVCGRRGYPYGETAQTQIMFIRHHGKCMRCFCTGAYRFVAQ